MCVVCKRTPVYILEPSIERTEVNIIEFRGSTSLNEACGLRNILKRALITTRLAEIVHTPN